MGLCASRSESTTRRELEPGSATTKHSHSRHLPSARTRRRKRHQHTYAAAPPSGQLDSPPQPPSYYHSPLELLQLAEEVVDRGTLPESSTQRIPHEVTAIQPAALAAVSIVGAQGDALATPCSQGDLCPVGLCLVRPAVANHLASCRGYIAYGTSPSREQLLDPKASMYYCAACLQELQAHVQAMRLQAMADSKSLEGSQTDVCEQDICLHKCAGSLDKQESVEEAALRMYFNMASADTITNSDSTLQYSRASDQNPRKAQTDAPLVQRAMGRTKSVDLFGSLLKEGEACCSVALHQHQGEHRHRPDLDQSLPGHQQPEKEQKAAVFHRALWLRYLHAKGQIGKLQAALLASKKLDRQSHQMYVVREGETARSISAALSLSIKDLEAANPDVPSLALQTNDCIVLPVAVCLPRLYVTKPGDTLARVASLCGVRLQALCAANGELMACKGPTVTCEPGWVLSLPGLKGDDDHVV